MLDFIANGLTLEMFVGLFAGVLLAVVVGWVFPGPGMAAVEILLVCGSLLFGIAWTIVSIVASIRRS
jgi:hypothetical protein